MPKTTSGRIVMPTSPTGKLDLAKKVFEKHTADALSSELKNLVDFNWDLTGPTVAAAKNLHEQAEALKGQMEEKYRQRDALLKPIEEINKASAAYLKGKYRTNPKKLSDWGFSVDDTPKKKVVKPAPGA